MASTTENPVVFFDITIGGSPKGRIEMELRADVVPKTAEVGRLLSSQHFCLTLLLLVRTFVVCAQEKRGVERAG